MLNVPNLKAVTALDPTAHLEASGIAYRRDVRLSECTYLRTGGTARLMIEPGSVEELAEAIRILGALGLPYKVTGNTSNLLFRDEATYSALVSTRELTRIRYDAEAGQIVADCGVIMPELSRLALRSDVRGFEGLEGIPGTIGGGVFMNAGAYGTELKDTLVSADVIEPDGRMRTVSPEELGLTHRASALRRGQFQGVIAGCTFRALPGDPRKIFGEMEVFHAKRHRYQDFMYPNLGSIFSGSPYRALAKRDRLFKIISSLFYIFRYEWKIFHRESPINRSWLNRVAMRRFDISYELQPFSDKTLNCLVNRGQGTDEMIRFIRQLEELTEGRIPLENEIVDAF